MMSPSFKQTVHNKSLSAFVVYNDKDTPSARPIPYRRNVHYPKDWKNGSTKKFAEWLKNRCNLAGGQAMMFATTTQNAS